MPKVPSTRTILIVININQSTELKVWLSQIPKKITLSPLSNTNDKQQGRAINKQILFSKTHWQELKENKNQSQKRKGNICPLKIKSIVQKKIFEILFQDISSKSLWYVVVRQNIDLGGKNFMDFPEDTGYVA